jgi:hypothetical protein
MDTVTERAGHEAGGMAAEATNWTPETWTAEVRRLLAADHPHVPPADIPEGLAAECIEAGTTPEEIVAEVAKMVAAERFMREVGGLQDQTGRRAMAMHDVQTEVVVVDGVAYDRVRVDGEPLAGRFSGVGEALAHAGRVVDTEEFVREFWAEGGAE